MRRAGLAVGGLGAMCALLMRRPELLIALGLLALPGVLAARSGRLALSRRLRALLPLLAALGLGAALHSTFGAGGRAGFAGQPWLLLGLRVLVAALWWTWATHDRTAGQLEAALRALRVPEAFVGLLFATRRFGSQLALILQSAWSAGVLRGGLLSWEAFRHMLGAVAGVVLLRAIDRSERVAIASALRGDAPEDA